VYKPPPPENKPSNKTGYRGVYPVKNGRFAAGLRLNGKATNLGTFLTAEEAYRVYCEAEAEESEREEAPHH
jgi:hypothetical protein